jgi:UDP-N-acetylglucosamine:LPS N-acetylglucosamine transferase
MWSRPARQRDTAPDFFSAQLRDMTFTGRADRVSLNYIDMGGSAGASAVGNVVPQALIKIKDDKIDLYAYLGRGSPRGNLPKD